MQIQEGKFYKTRDGQKVGPMVKSGIGYSLVSCDSFEYYENGQIFQAYDMAGDLVEEWTDKPTIWADMTPEEKGALLLARFEGKPIEMFADGPWQVCTPAWYGHRAYRIKPESKRETVKLYGGGRASMVWCNDNYRGPDLDTHRITFYTIDGEPDCSTIRMERLT
jgi:hypothetical protein